MTPRTLNRPRGRPDFTSSVFRPQPRLSPAIGLVALNTERLLLPIPRPAPMLAARFKQHCQREIAHALFFRQQTNRTPKSPKASYRPWAGTRIDGPSQRDASPRL